MKRQLLIGFDPLDDDGCGHCRHLSGARLDQCAVFGGLRLAMFHHELMRHDRCIEAEVLTSIDTDMPPTDPAPEAA